MANAAYYADLDAELAARWRDWIATADPVVPISRLTPMAATVSKFMLWRRELTE